MIYLPDTNAWIRFLNPGEHPVKDRFQTVEITSVWFCSVVKAELYFGAMRSIRKGENIELLDSLFRRFPSFPFDDGAARQYGSIRSDLAAKGTPIGPNDLMIAAIALSRTAVLVTHNTREFSRVSGLAVEDWEA